MAYSSVSLSEINKIITNQEMVKDGEITEMLYYYKIQKSQDSEIDVKSDAIDYNCNQEYIPQLKHYILNGMIYLFSMEEFNFAEYIGMCMNNDCLDLNWDNWDSIEDKISTYLYDDLLFKLLDLEVFKYDKETNEYNYTLDEKLRFKNFRKYLRKVFFKIVDTYIYNKIITMITEY